jgi:nitroreductase
MNFEALVNSRHSVRKYRIKEVPDNLIEKILNAAKRAPSAGNLQSYEVVVVKNDSRKELLSNAAHDKSFMTQASVILVFLADINKSATRYNERGRDLYAIQDATLAAGYAQLMIAELGLGSVWVGHFDESRVKAAVNAGTLKPICLMPIGYPDETPYNTPRRELGEFVHKETL